MANDLIDEVARSSLHPVQGGFRLKIDPRLAENTYSSDALEVHTLWDIISRLSVPLLLIRGSGSALLSRAVAERVAMVCANGRLQTIVGGHAIMLDNPSGFADVVLTFLRQATQQFDAAVAN